MDGDPRPRLRPRSPFAGLRRGAVALNRFGPVAGQLHFVPEPFQGGLGEVQYFRFVVHYEDSPLARRRSRSFLGNEGWDPVYGARPLKRAIQRRIMDPLSLDLLEGRFHDGDSILADAEGGRIVFRPAEAPVPAGA